MRMVNGGGSAMVWRSVLWVSGDASGFAALDGDALEQRAGVGGGQAGEAMGEAAADLEVLVVDRIGPAAAPLDEAVLGEQRDDGLGHAGADVPAADIGAGVRRVDTGAAIAVTD